MESQSEHAYITCKLWKKPRYMQIAQDIHSQFWFRVKGIEVYLHRKFLVKSKFFWEEVPCILQTSQE